MKSLTLVRVNLGAEHKQLQFPVSLLDNNATPAGWGVTPWRTKKKKKKKKGWRVLCCIFIKPEARKKIYCLCTSSWQTLATPLILSPVIQKAMSQDLTLSWNWLARTIGEIFFFFYLHFRVYVCKCSDPLCYGLFELIFWCYHVIPAAVICGKTPRKYCMMNYSYSYYRCGSTKKKKKR